MLKPAPGKLMTIQEHLSRLRSFLPLAASLLGGFSTAFFVLFQVPAFANSSSKVWFFAAAGLLLSAAFFRWKSLWAFVFSPVSRVQLWQRFFLFLIIGMTLVGLTATLTPIYWRVQRQHVISFCPDSHKYAPPSAVHPTVLLQMYDTQQQKYILLNELTGYPGMTPNPDGEAITQCWYLRAPDTFQQNEGYLFLFDTTRQSNVRIRVAINDIVDNNNVPTLSRVHNPVNSADGVLHFPNVDLDGQISSLTEWLKISLKAMALGACALLLSFLAGLVMTRWGLTEGQQSRSLSAVGALVISVGLQPQLLAVMNRPSAQFPWYWLIEAAFLTATALLMVLAYRKDPVTALIRLAAPLEGIQSAALMAFSVVFGTLTAFATLFFSRYFLLNPGTVFLIILVVLFLSLLIVQKSQQIPAPRICIREKAWKRILLYALPFVVVGVFYWLIFWPGLMYIDTSNQFKQIYSGVYNNHHPIMHTLLLWFLTRFWHSQGAVVLVQILSYSLVMGVFGWRMEVHGKPRWLVWGVFAVLLINPGSALMPVTVIKGTLHGILWIAAILMLLEIYYSNGAWLLRLRNCLLVVAVVVFSAFFRHNGLWELLPALVLSAVLFRRYFRQLAVITASILILYYGSLAVVETALHVQNGFGGFIVEMQYVYRSYIHQGYPLDDDTLEFLAHLPNKALVEMTDDYDSVQATDKTARLFKDAGQYNANILRYSMPSILAKDILKHPLPMLNHIYYTSRTMWVPVTPTIAADTMTSPLDKRFIYDMDFRVADFAELQEVHSMFPRMMELILEFANQNTILQELFWRPGLYSLLLLFGAAVIFIREKFSLKALMPWLPALIHFGLFTIFHLWSYNYRYHWGALAATVLLMAHYFRVSPVSPPTRRED